MAVTMCASQITATLFLGGADAAMNPALVSRRNITLIVNATLEYPCPVYHGVECIHVPVSDVPHARLCDHFEDVAQHIHENMTGSTLVHCAAGISRSPALVIAYLMRYKKLTLHQAHEWVVSCRPFVRPNVGFWRQLLHYEKEDEISYGGKVKEAPRFRHGFVFGFRGMLSLDQCEAEVSELESRVEKVMKLCSRMVEAGQAYNAANQLFLTGLMDFSAYHRKDRGIM
ncbi:dual specificity protein phosphatase 14-like, partial [Scleropages formosus]